MSAYPVMGHRKDAIPRDKLKLAMAFEGKNRHYEWHMIVARHIRDTAKRCGFEHEVEGIIGEFVDRIPHVISEISAELPSDFPDSIATPILVGVESTAQRLSDEIS
jgi:serine/threonine-protein kinase HipA